MVRNMLECASAREAAGRRAAGEDFGLLQQAYEKTCAAAEAQDLTAFIDNDVLFHLAIAKLCGNPIIESLLNTIRRITRYISSTGLMTAQQMEDSHREHREVYTAVMEGDQAGAEAAMAKHIHNATSRYKDYPEC